MTHSAPVLVWLRQDLRLTDNPALHAAAATSAPVIVLYIHDQETQGLRPRGGASKWWLHHSLAAFSKSLEAQGCGLTIRPGKAVVILEELIQTHSIKTVFWNRQYESTTVARDKSIKAKLSTNGVDVQSFNGNLLFEPWQVKTKSGTTPQTFTSFWRNARAQNQVAGPLPAPKTLHALSAAPDSLNLCDLDLRPTGPDWSSGLAAEWTPGEDGAKAALARFLDEALLTYASDRDRPDRAGTSRLSPHLHFGEISPRSIWTIIQNAIDERGEALRRPAEKFLSEIGWREFSYALLFENEDLPTRPLRKQFEGFPWSDDDSVYKAWCNGQTGYPIVDAGMRELWQTGYMHNRVRMIVASFLTKHLLVPWQQGEAWFWDTLVDADPANNAASWQWVAGCGADAAPYFRIFNPTLQGEKFDPNGAYVRRFVPELARLPDKWIHHPWDAPPNTLAAANVQLGATYPEPIVDHSAARDRALNAFQNIKGTATV